jgi:hypothetical protein
MPNQIAVGVAYKDPALEGATIDNSVIGGTTKAAGSFTALTATGNTTLGTDANSTLGFYGTTPATQRAAAIQAASVVSATSYISVTSNLAAFAAEVAATLTACGLWKGVA